MQKILEAHANVKDLLLIDAKLNYIKAWQSLPEYGISLFIVKFMGHKKEELLGVAFNRLMRMDISTGDHIKTWRYNTMKVKFLHPLVTLIPSGRKHYINHILWYFEYKL